MLLRLLLAVNVIIQVYLFVIALRKIKKPGFQSKIIPALFLFGSFVWEDVLVFSLFWIIGSIILFVLNSWQLTAVLILIFIIIRELFETIYWLFQQFHQTGFRPFDFGLKNLSNNGIYILYQVISISITVLSIFLLIILL